MRLPKLAIKRPIATFMLFLGLTLIGIVSFLMLPVDLMPKIESPAISVITLWPGASAEDIEINVTKHIENELGIISNLDKIRSTSQEGVSVVNCIFNLNSDTNIALNDIKEKLEFVKYKFASDVQNPMILKFNTDSLPILMYGITANENFENLNDIIDKKISPFLQRLQGVGSVQVFGALEKQINIKLNSKKLKKYNLSLANIEKILKNNNLNLPAGNIILGEKEYFIRVPGEYKTFSQIKNISLKPNVYLKDIAKIENGYKKITGKVKLNKRRSALLMIQKKSNANTLKVAKLVRQKIKKIEKTLPLDLKVTTIMDFSEFINKAIKNLLKTILISAFLVTLVTFLFLRNIRSSLIIILTIPFSVITSFAFIYFMGWSLNTISLAAIALSIGMVVDSAIVVVDNISKNLEKGNTVKESSLLGTKQVGSAIGASTLTTVVIFLPLVFVSGIIGIMFKQMGGVVTVTLLSSLFCALMLVPLLSFKILKKQTKIKIFEDLFLKLEEKYLLLLKKVLKNKKKTFLLSASIIVFTFFLFPFMGSEFFPTEDTGDLQITFEMPVGTPLKKNMKMCEKIEKKALTLVNDSLVEHSYWRAGLMDNSFGVAMGRKEGTHIGIYGMKLVKRNKRSVSTKELGRKIADAIKDLPEIVNIHIEDGNPMSSIVFGGIKPITLEILGHDLKKTEKLAKKIQKLAKKIPGTKDVTISRSIGKPELIVKPNRQKALFLGVDIFNLSTTLRTLFYGKEITNFRQGEKSYPVFMQLDEDEKKGLEDIQNTEIITHNNTKIRLDNIATIKESKGPMEIERKNNERVIKIDIDVYKRSQGEILKNLKSEISKLLIPKDIKIEFSGLVEHQKDSFKYIFYMLILGILLIYMVMASQFESLKDPFIIMFSVPFAIVGVVFALTITNTNLSVMSLIGVLMLTGIVVNNAIVIVDCINRFRKEKLPLMEAIYLAGKNRLRPVLITTLTTIFGMLPLVFNKEEGAEMWKPFGIAVIGGLLVSTMITLILIPLLYKIFHKEKI